MTYIKNIWVDQDVERPKTYDVTNNQDGSITLTDSFGIVTELGTPVNATNMNHIEEGIEQCYTDLADVDLNNLSATGEAKLGGNKVDRTGDTMTGSLTISAQGVSDGTDDCRCVLKNTEMELGVTPISNLVSSFGFNDKNNEEIGAVYCRQRTNSSTDVSILCKSLDGTETAYFRCGFSDSGTSYASCPTPVASSNNTNIATTKWVKDFAKTSGSNYLSTFSKAEKGYYKFTNGLIINWGNTEFAKTGTEVSFATAFTSTNYQVVFGEKSTDAGNTSVGGGIMSKNTTKFKAYGYKSGGSSAALYWIAIGY